MLLTLVAPVVLGAALRVDGAVTCPDPAEISANVQKVVDLSDDSAAKVLATVDRDGTSLVLRLKNGDGDSLGERRLTIEDDCTVMARAAAVVFAAWLSDEHPEFLVTLPSVASATPDDSAPKPVPATEPASVAKPALAFPAPSSAMPRAPAAAKPGAAHRIVVSASIGGVSSGAEFAPAAALGVSWDPAEQGLGARLSATWTGTRSKRLQDHEVSFRRWPVLVGPYLRFTRGRSRFDVEGGAALGWLRLGGRDFDSNVSRSDASFGAYAAVRFVPLDAPGHAFLSVAPVLWFGRTTAVATNPAAETPIPSFELLFALGAQLPL